MLICDTGTKTLYWYFHSIVIWRTRQCSKHSPEQELHNLHPSASESPMIQTHPSESQLLPCFSAAPRTQRFSCWSVLVAGYTTSHTNAGCTGHWERGEHDWGGGSKALVLLFSFNLSQLTYSVPAIHLDLNFMAISLSWVGFWRI